MPGKLQRFIVMFIVMPLTVSLACPLVESRTMATVKAEYTGIRGVTSGAVITSQIQKRATLSGLMFQGDIGVIPYPAIAVVQAIPCNYHHMVLTGQSWFIKYQAAEEQRM